jgi:hypothetical protein
MSIRIVTVPGCGRYFIYVLTRSRAERQDPESRAIQSTLREYRKQKRLRII